MGYWNPPEPKSSGFQITNLLPEFDRMDFAGLELPFDELNKKGDAFKVGFEKIPSNKENSFRVLCSKKGTAEGFRISVRKEPGVGFWVIRAS